MPSTENNYQDTDLGNITFNPRGEYDSEASYEYLDTVSYQGGTYMCCVKYPNTITGIEPEKGKNSEYWQIVAAPGGLTSDYVAMHDDVVNKAKQIETSRAAVELSQQEVEAAQADVSQMRQDTQEAAEEAASSRDSAAGYAQSAEASRTAAKESEDNVKAQESKVVQSVIEEGTKQIKAVSNKAMEQVKAIQEAGENALQNISNGVDKGLSEEGKAADAKATGEAISNLTKDLVKTDRKLDAIWKLNQGISYEFQTDDTEAYQKTVPSGAKMASVKSIGGKTIVWNAGELVSAPVSEVVQQGKNYFDFSKLVSDGVNVIDYDNQTITVPARTNNTGYNQTLRDLCPGITPGTYVFSMKRSNPNSGNGSYFLESAKDFPVDTPFELTDELLDNHIAWYNNPDSNIENVIFEIQIEKNSAKTLYSQYYQKSYKIPQAILNLPGYGWSAGKVRNEVGWENKQYIQRVNVVDLGTLNWIESGDTQSDGNSTYKSGSLNTVIRRYSIYSGNSICEKFNIVKVEDINRNEYEYSIGDTEAAYPLQFTVKSTFCTDENDFKNKINGIMLYYELAEPIVTDISDIIGNTFQEPFEVEAGGTLMFKNSNGDNYRIPVPSTEEYLVSLAEVVK